MSAPGISELLDARETLWAAARSAGPFDYPDLVARSEAMYELALRYGLDPFALDALETACRWPAHSAEPWAPYAARCDRLRREITDRSRDVRLRLALVDLHQGMTAAERARPEAERLLAAAVPVLREFPAQAGGKAAIGESALRQLALRTAPRAAGTGLDPGSVDAGVLLDGALALAADGHSQEAMVWLVAARRAAITGDDADLALLCAGYRAAIALRVDPFGAVTRMLVERTASALAALAATSAVAGDLAGHLRVEIARLDGDPDAIELLAERERESLRAGFPDQAASAALRRARMLLDAGQAAAARDTAVPAVLALDAIRFSLPDAGRRTRSLTVEVAAGYDTAFRAADACADRTAIAELIEVARANPIPRPRPPGDAADAVAVLAELDGTGGPSDAASLPSRTTLVPPPVLRTPWGTIALAGHLRRAGRYDPGRRDLAAAVDWRVGPGSVLPPTAR